MSKRSANKVTHVGAGIAGGGCGAILAQLASLIHNEALKQFALDVIPPLSVFLSVTISFVGKYIQDYLKRRGEIQDQEKSKDFYDRAKKTLEDSINNPLTSPAHKAARRKELERLETAYCDGVIEGFMKLQRDQESA